jgi:hypothetical protein
VHRDCGSNAKIAGSPPLPLRTSPETARFTTPRAHFAGFLSNALTPGRRPRPRATATLPSCAR